MSRPAGMREFTVCEIFPTPGIDSWPINTMSTKTNVSELGWVFYYVVLAVYVWCTCLHPCLNFKLWILWPISIIMTGQKETKWKHMLCWVFSYVLWGAVYICCMCPCGCFSYMVCSTTVVRAPEKTWQRWRDYLRGSTMPAHQHWTHDKLPLWLLLN